METTAWTAAENVYRRGFTQNTASLCETFELYRMLCLACRHVPTCAVFSVTRV